ERRGTLRVACPFEVKVASAGSVFPGTAIDVSAGGIGVRASLLPSLGERVMLHEATEAGQRFDLRIPAHVVWLRKQKHELGPGFGLAFDPENEAQERRLSQLLLFLLRRQRARL